MVSVHALEKSSRITSVAKINQEFEAFKQELLPRLSTLEQKIMELESAILEQKKQRYELENKISCIDPVLQESFTLLDRFEELQGSVYKLSEEVARLKGDLSVALNQRINIEEIVKEVAGVANESR